MAAPKKSKDEKPFTAQIISTRIVEVDSQTTGRVPGGGNQVEGETGFYRKRAMLDYDPNDDPAEYE